jgi:Ca2+-dependent lipid-binding protein
MDPVQYETQDLAIEQTPFEEVFLRFMEIILKWIFTLFLFSAFVLIFIILFF